MLGSASDRRCSLYLHGSDERAMFVDDGRRSCECRQRSRSSERRCESRPCGLGSAASIRDMTATMAASSTSDPSPVKRKSRMASAASGGVLREGLVPDLTDVATTRETAAVLAPRMAEANVLKAAPLLAAPFLRASGLAPAAPTLLSRRRGATRV